MSIKELHIPARVLRPKQELILHCANCDKPQARWDVVIRNEQGGYDPQDICALCFLYESEWGQKRREQIDGVIARVEVKKSLSYMRDPEQRLLLCADADKILGGIAVASRMREAMISSDEEEGCPKCGCEELATIGFVQEPNRRKCAACKTEWIEEEAEEQP